MMKRLITLSLLSLMLLTAWAEKVQVTVTMNSVSRTMTLTPKSGGDPVEVGTPTSNKYSFEAEPGSYVLEGFNTSGVSNGTLEVELQEGSALSVFTVTAKASNKNWVLGIDYTVQTALMAKDMSSRVYTVGKDKDEQTAVTFLALSGDTYSVTLVPSDEHKAEGYLNFFDSNPLTFNKTVNGAIPMGYTCTLTAPKGATVFVGSKVRHFVPFTPVLPNKTEDVDGYVKYYYTLGEKLQYNYRVSADGLLTKASLFTMPSAEYAIEVTSLEGGPKQVDRDPNANNKYNVADLFTNADAQGCLSLRSGEQFQLVTLRAWEIVNTITANYFIEPDYHFTVVDADGQPSTDVVEVSADGVVTAKKAGTAFVLVTYDALHAEGQVGGPLFSAIWPENTGVVVVNVDAAATGITPNMALNAALNTNADKLSGASIDAEMDVLYYLGDYAEYTFKPEGVTAVAVASPEIAASVSYNGFTDVEPNADGTYTLRLTEGRNIVRLTSAAGAVYQVVRAKKCSYVIANATNPDADIKPGDKVNVTINGLYHPAHKLAGVYNMAASIQYNDAADNVLASKTNQYQFAATDAARAVTVTIPEDWDENTPYVISGGVIKCSGYGDPYGGHRDINYTLGKNPNFTAVQHTSFFGALPDITVYEPKDYDLVVLTFEDADYKGSGNVVSDDLSHGWSTLIDSDQFGGDLLYGDMASIYMWYDENNTGLSGGINPATDYGDGFWNGGTAVSNYVLRDFNGAGFTEQLSAYNPAEGGKGGHNNSDNFLVCYGYDDGNPYGRDNRPVITLADGEAVIDHAYVNLGAYGLNSAFNGDDFNTEAASDDDWVDIIAEALDAEGNPTGQTVTFRAVNGKSNILQTWKKWDLSALGVCAAVRFNVTSSMAGTYGMNFPAYFLLDDIAVRVPKPVVEPQSDVAAFEDLTLEPESVWAGDEDGEDWYYGLGYTQRFVSGGYSFVNYCIPDFDTWIGYAYTNKTSTEYNSLDDQFNSCVGSGNNGSQNYVVAYPDGTMWGETLSVEVVGDARVVPGFYITNTAWVVKSITDTDNMTEGAFAEGDYFKVVVHAHDANGIETATRDFFLANYRYKDESKRYYVDSWEYVDLSQLGEAASFTFTFEGSRTNAYGVTTPTYFCIDDFGAEGVEAERPLDDIATGVVGVRTVTNNAVHAIDGTRVNDVSRPGIYIINGRKVVVK